MCVQVRLLTVKPWFMETSFPALVLLSFAVWPHRQLHGKYAKSLHLNSLTAWGLQEKGKIYRKETPPTAVYLPVPASKCLESTHANDNGITGTRVRLRVQTEDLWKEAASTCHRNFCRTILSHSTAFTAVSSLLRPSLHPAIVLTCLLHHDSVVAAQ